MVYKTKISSKGQIVIPKEIREKYGYREGVEVTLKPIDETKLLIERSPRLSELSGYLGEAKAAETLQREREKELNSEVEKEREEELSRREKGEAPRI
ncbi:MAG: AbrB/MazE/SpoVT family DNA-binding domain-containing protein [Candidatus Jordarchaeaceae archaeon]